MQNIELSLLEIVVGGADRHPPPLGFGGVCRNLMAKPLGEVSRRELALAMGRCGVPQPSKRLIQEESRKR